MTISRRQLLKSCGMGLGSLGLAGILSNDTLMAKSPFTPKNGHFKPRAKAIIHLFLNGGLSHVDSFDPKPQLDKYNGKKLPIHLKTERETGVAMASPFKFKRYGKSGIPVSDLFPHLAQSIDDCCVIRSMKANVPNHEPSLMLMNCGESTLIRPSMGSWLNYGLGTENQNLPGFIAMCPGGYPIKGSYNWSSSFLPGVFQGTYIDPKHQDINKLIANIRNKNLNLKDQRKQLDLVQALNKQHSKERHNDDQLETRIQSYELAYRMQMEATDAFDISKEPDYIRKMYGTSTQARQTLMARRLVERGVRYVQLYHGAGQPWDSHDDLEKNHKKLAAQWDQAMGALIVDLKQRGLLDETIVLICGEFGRTPTVEMPKPGSNQGKINGRDHNHHGFSAVLAGGGIKGGMTFGETDEFGFKAVKDEVHVHDLHATMLYLMGLDHEKLTYRFAGRDFRLTDVHGDIVTDIIA